MQAVQQIGSSPNHSAKKKNKEGKKKGGNRRGGDMKIRHLLGQTHEICPGITSDSK